MPVVGDWEIETSSSVDGDQGRSSAEINSLRTAGKANVGNEGRSWSQLLMMPQSDDCGAGRGQIYCLCGADEAAGRGWVDFFDLGDCLCFSGVGEVESIDEVNSGNVIVDVFRYFEVDLA